MGCYLFSPPQDMAQKPVILVAYAGLGPRNGVKVYYSDESVKLTGTTEWETDRETPARANPIGEAAYKELRAGKTFTVSAVGTV
ncbi:MAG: hypothetical protein HYV03_08290, partial [Deltaproteobacteria bacterium]|nr:hypothetical protein [Deltaproteobacteria bacterium]